MSAADVAAYERDGYLVLRGFADGAETDAVLGEAIALARRNAMGTPIAPAFVQPESNLAGYVAPNPEDAVAKIYRLHRLEPFHSFATAPRLTELVAALVADTIRPHVADLRTAVLYEKSRSIVQADYVWRRTDRWIDFPWSTLPPVQGTASAAS